MKKLTLFVLLISFVAVALLAADTRVITEYDGTKVTIPVYPKRIACAHAPAYDKVLMLSQASRIGIIPRAVSPWVMKFYPELKKIETGASHMSLDPERLLRLKIDLVIYPKGRTNSEHAAQSGIAMVCSFNSTANPSSLAEHIVDFQNQVKFFADILGGDAESKAKKYIKYQNDIISRVKAITANIKQSNKPTVYYGQATNVYATQGRNSVMQWYTELAGGRYLASQHHFFSKVSREEVLGWNPDIILIGMHGVSFSGESKLTSLNDFRAQREGRVYNVPQGVFFWEMAGCETVLLPIHLGKIFHPELFANWDLVKEMKKFYADIYGIKISDQDAKRILDALPPES